MASTEIRIYPAGDAAILVDVGDGINLAINRRVHVLARRLTEALSGHTVEVVPAYRNVLVCYDPVELDGEVISELVRGSLLDQGEPPASRRFTLPAVYGDEFGPDLDEVARYLGLQTEEVVSLHAKRDYPIFCLGFSPGFPFLGGLDERLHVPRLDTPRPRVPAGTIGIAGGQTGVYPTSTPGGWRLIGRTPLVLFDPDQTPPVPYQPGDVVRFTPVDRAEYERLKSEQRMPRGERVEA